MTSISQAVLFLTHVESPAGSGARRIDDAFWRLAIGGRGL
jgi:hypothetical protein